MKTTIKRTRTDSTNKQVRAMQNANKAAIEPPIKLKADVMPYWHAIIKARPRDSWLMADLFQAVQVARALADIERLTLEIQTEGDTTLNDRKAIVINPKHRLVDMLTKRAVMLARLLHIHPEATQGKSERQGDTLRQELDSELEDDGLLARLHH